MQVMYSSFDFLHENTNMSFYDLPILALLYNHSASLASTSTGKKKSSAPQVYMATLGNAISSFKTVPCIGIKELVTKWLFRNWTHRQDSNAFLVGGKYGLHSNCARKGVSEHSFPTLLFTFIHWHSQFNST
jgi:hypothetical protein